MNRKKSFADWQSGKNSTFAENKTNKLNVVYRTVLPRKVNYNVVFNSC